jgi:hypothetical protein
MIISEWERVRGTDACMRVDATGSGCDNVENKREFFVMV